MPILIIGIWGGLVPFIGPTFGYYMGAKVAAWTWSESHFTLHVAPAIGAVLGAGAMLLGRRLVIQALGSLVATLAGVWFVLGPSLHSVWAGSGAAMGSAAAHGGTMHAAASGGMMHATHAAMGSSMSAIEAVGYHYGTGSAIAVLSAVALGVLLATAPSLVPAGAAAREPRRPRIQAGRTAQA